MNIPDILIIGAQKSATTWLYKCLREHPQLFLPKRKHDVEHLASSHYDSCGRESYFELFSEARPGQKIVDASVDYLFDEAAPAIIARYIPSAQFIVSLRNPTDRAISAINWYARKGFIPPLPLDTALAYVLEPEHWHGMSEVRRYFQEIRERGQYEVQLQRYLDRYPRNRFLVLIYDHINSNPGEILRAVFGFCGVDANFRPAALGSRPLAASGSRVLLKIESALFPPNPGRMPSLPTRIVSKVAQVMNETLVRLGRRHVSDSVSPDCRARLAQFYAPSIAKTSDILAQLRVVGSEDLPPLKHLWR